MHNPYLDTGKRDSDATTHEWPAVTTSLLADHERLDATHDPSQINQPLFALIRARKAIGDARLALHKARLLFKDNILVSDRLESIAAQLSEEMRRYPVSIVGKAPFGRGFDALK